MKNIFSKESSGFTLIELLVVIAVVGMLSTMAVVSLNSAKEKSKISRATNDINQIYKAMQMMANDTGEWPGHNLTDMPSSGSTNEVCSPDCTYGLSDPRAGLVATDGSYQNWNGPYIGKIESDPWGHQYFFDSDYQVSGNNKAVVGSYGPNGVGNNIYDADNIIKIIGN